MYLWPPLDELLQTSEFAWYFWKERDTHYKVRVLCWGCKIDGERQTYAGNLPSTNMKALPRSKRKGTVPTLWDGLIIVRPIAIWHHVMIQPYSRRQLGLEVMLVRQVTWASQINMQTCRRSHLFKNNTMFTLASSLLDTTAFHNISESSSLFTFGSCIKTSMSNRK